MHKDSFCFTDRARAVVVAVSTSLLLTVATAGPLAAAPALFDAPSAALAPAPDGAGSGGSAVLRQRLATPNLDRLVRPDGSPAAQTGQQIDLNLFFDAHFTMTIGDVTPSGRGHTLSGTLLGVDLGAATLAVYDGALAGLVTMPQGVYRIGSDASGSLVVQQIDQAALPPEGSPRLPPPSPFPGSLDSTVGAEIPDIAADTASQIDVMVLYTPAARAAAGGVAAIQADISLAISLANGAYANASLVQRLRAVYVNEIAITEHTGSSSFNNDLDTITNSPTIARLREFTRADLVTLVAEHGPSSPFCGLGFLLTSNTTGFAPFAFNVVERICASGNLSYAHENGHNMGAHHDPFVSVGEPTVFPYSHGFVDLVNKFRTIMAYNDQCAAIPGGCTRIQAFSSPLFTFNGHVVGTGAISDNARTLSETANNVANFRQALVSQPTASTGVNKTSFAVNDSLVVSVALQNLGRTGTADIYFGLLAPDNSVAFFTDVVVTPSSGYAFGNFLNYASYHPIATGIPLATPFSANIPSFVSYKWTGGEPRGGYALLLLVVTTGALNDGVLASNELISASLTPFSFPP